MIDIEALASKTSPTILIRRGRLFLRSPSFDTTSWPGTRNKAQKANMQGCKCILIGRAVDTSARSADEGW